MTLILVARATINYIRYNNKNALSFVLTMIIYFLAVMTILVAPISERVVRVGDEVY